MHMQYMRERQVARTEELNGYNMVYNNDAIRIDVHVCLFEVRMNCNKQGEVKSARREWIMYVCMYILLCVTNEGCVRGTNTLMNEQRMNMSEVRVDDECGGEACA